MDRSGTLPNSASTGGLDASVSSLNSVDHDANLDTQQSKWTSTNTSLTASPLASRETSPARTHGKPTTRPARPSVTATANSSRKSSAQDPSPSRSRSSHLPTAASASRQQLSAATTPTLPPPSTPEPILRTPQPQKPLVATENPNSSPRWPVSPRLKSPPPALNKPAVPLSQPFRKNEQEPPAINVQRATPSPNPRSSEASSQAVSDAEGDDGAMLPSGMRTPARGPSGAGSTLETVQEVSQPNTPGPDLNMAIEKLSQAAAATSEMASRSDPALQRSRSARTARNGTNSESGSDSGSVKADTRRSSSAAPPPLLHSRQSSTALKFAVKGHTTGETSSKHITVEEEEVNSMPRVTLGLKDPGQSVSGSLKTKQSSETIRPRKEKKRATRKQPTSGPGEPPNLLTTRPPKLRHSQSTRSISTAVSSCRSPAKLYGQGPYSEAATSPQQLSKTALRSPSITTHMTNLLTGGSRVASSKADIFEAKVASAVEEANSSDSDETFVYDSNPPDVSDRPRRYHSRTPSATSMVSQLDRNALRGIHTVHEGTTSTNPAIKKNMKFVNTYNSNGAESMTGEDDGNGTSRSNAGSARGTARHHHHAGRWGRGNGSNHLSLFDNESPFPNAARSKLSGATSRVSSTPPSPRFPPHRSSPMNGNKRQMTMVGGYDMDDTTTGADDERTPLIHNGNSLRSNRSPRSRRVQREQDIESRSYHRQRPSFLNRFASCLVLTVMLLLVITGAIGFMFATSQPLLDLELVKISNVLASEQELMMDITVRAHNPNIVVVSVDAADLEVFAKSPHAGTDSEWWRSPHGDDFDILDDPPNDPPIGPPEDPPGNKSAPNMRLGNIVTLDSPLNFEGSFFRAGISMASGELRLARPGNDTDGGSERWERILNDEFLLIVKGVLKYTLPLSQRIRSATVTAQTKVKPNSANDPTLRPNGTDFEIGIS
ncbi:phospholipid metabolism enzyme regulator [Apiospora saccharicola]|uniref:Phospholipid metabolism enzyme regulator n=1 Tax=Apiospora saccharicola TaxID=335842 RepID=A0ABR1U468_9PEZI